MALAAKAEGHGQAVGPQDGGGGLVKTALGVHGDHQLVPQGPVVVAGQVADGLGGGPGGKAPALHPGPAGDGRGQGGQPGRPAVDKAGPFGVEDMPFDQIPGGVAERADVLIQGGQGPLARGDGPPAHGAGVGAPGLAVEDLFPFAVAAVQFGADAAHQARVQQGHQVKAEAVHMVFLGPVQHRFQDVAGAHAALAGQIVAAARAVGGGAVGVLAVEVPGLGAPQPGIQLIGVVVHHIHHHPEAVAVQSLHRGLQLPDTNGAVVGIGGIPAVGDVVIHRVIAPVVVVPLAFGHRTEVIHRHQLHMGDPQLPEVVDAGGVRVRARYLPRSASGTPLWGSWEKSLTCTS